jgi:sugar phosphate isomerase/epimerase
MKKQTRRSFFRTAGVGLAGMAAMPGVGKAALPIAAPTPLLDVEIGIASYGLRNLSVDEVIELMNDLQLSKISIKSMHLPYDLSPADIKKTMMKIRGAGLDPYAGGVIYMKSTEEVARAFDYAKVAGFDMIVGVPDYNILDLAEQKVKAYNIRLAIHNHGPDGMPYPNAMEAYNRIKDRDKRMGICMDVAHIARSGLNPVEEIHAVKDRLFDVHLRDNTASSKEGTACRPGQGNLDLPGIIRTLWVIGYQGVYTIEYGIEEDSPLTGTALTVGYIQGILASLAS